MPVLSAHAITNASGLRPRFDQATFTIRRGEKVAPIGSSYAATLVGRVATARRSATRSPLGPRRATWRAGKALVPGSWLLSAAP